jgi:hypothetical protein
MANDDPFADLGQTLEDESNEQEDATTPNESTGSTMSDVPPERIDDVDEEQGEERDPVKDPAFTYEAANQRPFYAREETIGDFDSWLNYELERELSNRDYQNIVVREMTDALLRTVVEEGLVDEVAERFEQAREETSPE